VDVYVRAALAESVALVFLPLTLWAFYETIAGASAGQGETRTASRVRVIWSILFAALAYAGMVFAHNGIALLFSIVLGAWIVFLILRACPLSDLRSIGAASYLKRIFRPAVPTVAGLALGLGLTCIFLIPLVLEYRYINVAQWTANYYDYQDHFVELYQLLSPVWGFGISNRGPVDGLSFQLGLVPIVLFLMSLFVIARNGDSKRAYVLFFCLVTLAVILLMLDRTLPAWQAVGLASVAQFPWRLLTLTTVSMSIVGGAVLLLDKPNEGPQALARGLPLSVLLLSALVLLGSYPYITAQNILEPREGPVSLRGLMAFENSANEMTGTTVYADEQPRWSPLADNYFTGRNVRSKIDFSTVPETVFVRIPRDSLRVDGERVDYNAPDGDVTIVYNVQMYPGWRAYLTRSRSTEIVQELDIAIEPPYGRIKVTLPQGEHGVWLRFQDTPPRTIGTIISGISLLIAVGLGLWALRAARHNDTVRDRR
jgi:hypothetical protein